MSSEAPRQIVLASSNKGKLAELIALLGDGWDAVTAASLGITLPEETGATFEENAALKAIHVRKESGMMAIADDSGLVVDALGGAPGVYSARYSGPNATDDANNAKLLHALRDVPPEQRTAHFASCVCIAFTPDRVETVFDTCEGTIATEPRGDHGFGYDPLFLLPDGRTMAELTMVEKNVISHRAKAMRKAILLLKQEAAVSEGEPTP